LSKPIGNLGYSICCETIGTTLLFLWIEVRLTVEFYLACANEPNYADLVVIVALR